MAMAMHRKNPPGGRICGTVVAPRDRMAWMMLSISHKQCIGCTFPSSTSTDLGSEGPNARFDGTHVYARAAFRVRFCRLREKNPLILFSLVCDRVFGLTNLAALREGKVGRQCRGEEHVVELVRNKSSGKIRVYWNQSNITHLFRQRYIHEDSIVGQQIFQYVWKTRSGETLKIVYVPRETVDESIQFDFFVDDVNFTNLPTVGQLGRREPLETLMERRSPHDDTGSQRSFDSSIASNELEDPSSGEITKGFYFVGYNSLSSSKEDEIINDELHSYMYSNALSSLRTLIVSYLPQTEEIVSRSIINAFFVDSSMVANPDILEEKNAHQVEVDLILEARRWARLNIDVAPRQDVEDLSLHFLQRCIDQIFLLVRNEELNSTDEAARIVLSVAMVLGIKFAYSITQDTLLFDDLALGTSTDDMREALSSFGEIDASSISSATRSFGFCRFVFEDSVNKCFAAMEEGSLVINGTKPTVSVLYSNSVEAKQSDNGHECHPETEIDGIGEEELSLLTAIPSPPHLMGSLCYSPDSVAQKLPSYDLVGRHCERNAHRPRFTATSSCY